MDVGSRRRPGGKNSVVAGSVWETRMKCDEVKGGIKVFNGDENSEETGGDGGGGGGGGGGGDNVGAAPQVNRRPKTTIQTGGRRKTWKSEISEGINKSPIQIGKGGRSDLQKNCEEQSKELSVSVDGGMKKSPIQVKKTRSEAVKELSVSVDGGIERRRSPRIQAKKITRSDNSSSSNQKAPENGGNGDHNGGGYHGDGDGNGDDDDSVQLKKAESESNKVIEKNPVDFQLKKSKSIKVVDELDKGIEKVEAEDGIGKNTIEESDKFRSDEICNEIDVCQEKVITTSLSNVGQIAKSAPKMLEEDEYDEEDEDYDDDDDEDEDEVEKEKMEVEVEVEVEIEKKSFDIKEINVLPEEEEEKLSKVEMIVENKKIHHHHHHQFQQKTVPISSPIVSKQSPPVFRRSSIHQNLNKPTSNFTKPSSIFTKPTPNLAKSTPVQNSSNNQRIPKTQNRLQNLVDLIMWRDVSRSAFVFGIGTFMIVSSSYSKDLNISFISVISYLGLVYLALIFLHRSIIRRGVLDVRESNNDYVVGEEEAIWILKLLLPYINEFLLNLRGLFSGDPATTMKLAVVLFVLAKCGSSFTIWKMAKLGFFGVFTVPKVCSSYSTQLNGYGKFWVQRFRDAWDSCTHKKAVAGAIFTLVWNLSSIIARIWAVFMLFVAVRYYQQSLMKDDWVEAEADFVDTCQNQTQVSGQRQGRGPTLVELRKEKKVS